MKNKKIIFKTKKTHVRKKRLLIKRLSPFLLLAVFLVLLFCYKIINRKAGLSQYILLPFLMANIVFADFALWNFFEGKKN